MSEEDKQKKKEYQKNRYQFMPEENKLKYREYMKEYRKNRSKNVSKKFKKNNELKWVEADAVTYFIKDDVESFSDAKIYSNDDDFEEDRVIGLK